MLSGCLSVSLSLGVSVFVSFCLFLCVALSVCLFLFLCVPLSASLSLCASVCFSFSLCLCLSVYLFFFPCNVSPGVFYTDSVVYVYPGVVVQGTKFSGVRTPIIIVIIISPYVMYVSLILLCTGTWNGRST